MGTTLHIETKSNSYWGTKMYGYITPINENSNKELELRSYKYLKEINKLPIEDSDYSHFWCYPWTEPIELTAEEIEKFIDLYAQDYLDYPYDPYLCGYDKEIYGEKTYIPYKYDIREDKIIQAILKEKTSALVNWG